MLNEDYVSGGRVNFVLMVFVVLRAPTPCADVCAWFLAARIDQDSLSP
jgi:hypothetical protein